MKIVSLKVIFCSQFADQADRQPGDAGGDGGQQLRGDRGVDALGGLAVAGAELAAGCVAAQTARTSPAHLSSAQ